MKAYKTMMFIVIGMTCFLGTLSAQNSKENDTSSGSKEVLVNQSLDVVADNDLFKILLLSCNDGIVENKLTKQFIVETRPGQQKELCLLVYNQLKKKVDITLSFYEGEKNKDTNTVYCGGIPKIDRFKPLIKDINTGGTFGLSLEPEQQIVHRFKIKATHDMSGTMYGCIGAIINGSASQKPGDLFAIIVRKYIPVTLAITGSVYPLGRRDDIDDTYKAYGLKIIIVLLVIAMVATIFKKDKGQKKHHTKK